MGKATRAPKMTRLPNGDLYIPPDSGQAAHEPWRDGDTVEGTQAPQPPQTAQEAAEQAVAAQAHVHAAELSESAQRIYCCPWCGSEHTDEDAFKEHVVGQHGQRIGETANEQREALEQRRQRERAAERLKAHEAKKSAS